MQDVIFGLIAIAAGALFCFRGYLAFRLIIPIWGAFVGFATGAGAVTALPLHPVGTDFSRPYWREGEPDPGATAARADIRMATPGYFDAMRMTLRRGRGFTDADDERAPRVIVANETLARQAFGADDLTQLGEQVAHRPKPRRRAAMRGASGGHRRMRGHRTHRCRIAG